MQGGQANTGDLKPGETMVVAIDGPAGVGKSTLAIWVAETFGFFNLNSGSFYRAMVVKVLESSVDTSDEMAVVSKELLKSATFTPAKIELEEEGMHEVEQNQPYQEIRDVKVAI